MRALPVALIALATLLAGCMGAVDVTPNQVDDARTPDVQSLIGTPIVQHHDHTDPSLHVGGHNLEFVAWEPFIPEEMGEEGFAGFRTCDTWGFLATDGAHGGFLVIDLTDPTKPELVSQYVTAGAASQEAVPTPDCEHVLLNQQDIVSPLDLAEAPEEGHGAGIQVIDVSDKANPEFVSFTPVETYGSHTIFTKEIDGQVYAFYSGQPTRHGVPTGQTYTQPVGNVVNIAEFVTEPEARLKPVAQWRYLPGVVSTYDQGSFPHDMWVETHPETGQEVMYVAHWDGGAITVDVTDPANPRTLSVWDDKAPSNYNRIHFYRPDPTVRDGGVYAYSGPEIDHSPGEPGYVRVYDVTDPAAVEQVNAWRLPGQVENDMPYLFTPHNFAPRGDLLAVAHYHAGVWLLDISDPLNVTHVGYYLPHGEHGDPFEGEVWRKTPNFPVPYFPNVYDARWYDSPTDGETYLLVSERGSGLYVLKVSEALEPMLTASG